MKDTKLYSLLKILSADEFKMLRRATQSPQYFGSLQSEKLYTALRPKYPDFVLSPTDLRKVYKKVFPSKPFNPKKLQKAFDDFQKIVEALLVKLHLDKTEFSQKKNLVLAAKERPELFYLFKKTQEDMHLSLEKKEMQNENYWDEKAQLYDQLYRNRQHNKYDVEDKTLDKLNTAINRFFTHFVKSRTELTQSLSNNTNPAYSSRFLKDIEHQTSNGE